LVTPLKNVLSVMGLINHPGIPKPWTIAHENRHKRKNDEFFVVPLQNVQTVIFLVNLHGTPKLWAIANKNGSKTQKQRVLGNGSQICTDYHIPCKSPRNTKTMGNSSQQWP
jgi:hypothetical protein